MWRGFDNSATWQLISFYVALCAAALSFTSALFWGDQISSLRHGTVYMIIAAFICWGISDDA